MPLKPVFEKSPLTSVTCQPLSAGFVRMKDHAVLNDLYRAICENQSAASFEASFRLACLICEKPMEETCAARILTALQSQKPDGSFAVSIPEAVAILRAAWAMYEYESRKPLLDYIAKWCTWAVQNWDVLSACSDLWESPADLLELLENMYKVTGKAALLTMCERLSSETMAWAGVLNTISAQRPTRRTVTKVELDSGVSKEQGSHDGYYSHLYRTNHAVLLADGARAATARGLYSGSATELNAAKNGWERLVRYHGAICGGLTADVLLEGTAPSEAVSTAGVGAWAEALCSASVQDNEWIWESLERMLFNAMPAAVSEGNVHAFQRVNSLKGDVDTTTCFFVPQNHQEQSLIRLARGFAAAASHAVTVSPNGLNVNLYMPGMYIVPVGDQLIAFAVAATAHGYKATVRCKQEVKADIALRVPGWSRTTEIKINGSETAVNNECKRNELSLERTWHDGDVITVEFEQVVRVMDAHHQGKYLMRGPLVMALPAEPEHWALSFVSPVEAEGKVGAVLDQVSDWHLRDGEPADIPVLPAASNALETSFFVPYAASAARIALFPGRKNG